ncbi:MAG: DEP domain-containing protein [Prochloraceae cyanobacterium]
MEKDRQTVLSILMMRFGLDPYTSLPLVNDWLSKHPNLSWSDLKDYLLNGKVIFQAGLLQDVGYSEINWLIQKMRDRDGIEIKDRWYNFKFYRQCFIGCEAVKWLMKTQNISQELAIQLGQILLDRRIIHHVHDQHNFRNEFLFYRFYQDEIAANQKNNLIHGRAQDMLQYFPK